MLGTREELAGPALDAVAATADASIPTEVVLVLARCDADVHAALARRAPDATIVRCEANCGTAVAWNLAAEAARAPLLVTLHEDTEVQPGWLAALVAARADDSRRRVVGARLLNPDRTLQCDGWTVWSDGCCTPVDERGTADALSRTEPRVVDFVSSAAMLLAREDWESIGGFDERYYPAIYVEIDFCTAVAAAGGIVVSVPAAIVVHRQGAMVRDGDAMSSPELRDHIADRNRRRFARKWAARLDGQCDAGERGWWDRAVPDLVGPALARAEARAGLSDDDGEPPRALRGLTLADDDGPRLEPDGAERRLRVAAPVERRLLEIELETRAGFAGELLAEQRRAAPIVATADATALDLAGHRAALAEIEPELAAHRSEVELLHELLRSQRAYTEHFASALAEEQRETALLRERAATLDRILAGRWWRLRGALRRALP